MDLLSFGIPVMRTGIQYYPDLIRRELEKRRKEELDFVAEYLKASSDILTVADNGFLKMDFKTSESERLYPEILQWAYHREELAKNGINTAFVRKNKVTGKSSVWLCDNQDVIDKIDYIWYRLSNPLSPESKDVIERQFPILWKSRREESGEQPTSRISRDCCAVFNESAISYLPSWADFMHIIFSEAIERWELSQEARSLSGIVKRPSNLDELFWGKRDEDK